MILKFFKYNILFILFLSAYASAPGALTGENKTAVKDKLNSAGIENIEKIPKLTAEVDRKKVSPGDFIILTLKYSLPAGASFTPDTQLKGLDELTIAAKSAAQDQITFRIIIDKIESFKIGPLSLTFKDKEGNDNIIRADPIEIEVISNFGGKPAEAQLRPIEDIIPTYPLWLKMLPWTLGSLLVLMIIAGIAYWRKRKRAANETLLSIKPPHVIAREEIEKLKELNLIDKGQYKEFYFRFSEILREYIEAIRGIPAIESTTEEISKKLIKGQDRILIPLLRGADMIKFADSVPTKAKNEEDISAAFKYIKDTMPVVSMMESDSAVNS